MVLKLMVPDVHKIEVLRAQRGWTRGVLAEKSKVTERTLARLAQGVKDDMILRKLNVELKTINGLANAFGVSGISLVKEIPD